MDDDEKTFASVGPSEIVHYARCWDCMLGQHYDPPERHDWANEEDREYALSNGQPDPKGKRCGCWCADDWELTK